MCLFFSCHKTTLTTMLILFVVVLEKILFEMLLDLFCPSFLHYLQQETGIGKTVNSFRKHATAGNVAKTLVKQWKKLIPSEKKR